MEVSTETAVLNEGIKYCKPVDWEILLASGFNCPFPTLCITCPFYLQELTLSVTPNLSSSVIVAVLCNKGCSVAGFAVVLHYS